MSDIDDGESTQRIDRVPEDAGGRWATPSEVAPPAQPHSPPPEVPSVPLGGPSGPIDASAPRVSVDAGAYDAPDGTYGADRYAPTDGGHAYGANSYVTDNPADGAVIGRLEAPTASDADEWVRLPREAGRFRKVLLTLVVLGAVVVGLGFVGSYYVNGQLFSGTDDGDEVPFTVALGDTTEDIATKLEDAGVISNGTLWRYYVDYKGEGPFQAGEYVMFEDMSADKAIALLNEGPAPITLEQFLVPEGLRLSQFFPRIADGIERFTPESVLTALFAGAAEGTFQSRFIEASGGDYEGLFFPAQYEIADTETEANALQRMLTKMDEVTNELEYPTKAAELGITEYEAIIIASLIEREAQTQADRPKISRVIYNRLAAGMQLQIDATVLYCIDDPTITRVLFEDLEADCPHNTYKIEGLPPTPIAAPGRAALEAAVNPEPGPWLFYVVTDRVMEDGIEKLGHSFAETNAEHEANIARAAENGLR